MTLMVFLFLFPPATEVKEATALEAQEIHEKMKIKWFMHRNDL